MMNKAVDMRPGVTMELSGFGAVEMNSHFLFSWQFLATGNISIIIIIIINSAVPRQEKMAPVLIKTSKCNNIKLCHIELL